VAVVGKHADLADPVGVAVLTLQEHQSAVDNVQHLDVAVVTRGQQPLGFAVQEFAGPNIRRVVPVVTLFCLDPTIREFGFLALLDSVRLYLFGFLDFCFFVIHFVVYNKIIQ